MAQQEVLRSIVGRLLGLNVYNDIVFRGTKIYYGDDDTGLSQGFLDLSSFATNWVDPRDWVGFDVTGAHAVDSYLNLAVAQAIASKLPLRVPSGLFRLDDTVHLANAYQDAVTFEGNGGIHVGQSSVTNYSNNTVFLPSFKDKPVFSINSARGTVMRNFAILGLNAKPIDNSLGAGGVRPPNDVKANYIDADARDDQYSPYCAIAIDAFNSAVPVGGGYPGMSAKYHGSTFNGSNNTLIENVSIRRFVVGIGQGLSGVGSQSDQVTYRACDVRECDTAYVIGHAQAKITLMDGGAIYHCRQAVDGNNYGITGQGVPPKLHRHQFNYVYRIFVFPAAFGPLTLDTCYAESFRTFGEFGTGFSTLRNSLLVAGGDYSLRTDWNGTPLALPPLVLETAGPATFKGVSFDIDGGGTRADALNFTAYSAPIELDSCDLPGTAVSNVPPFVGLSQDNTGGVTLLHNCYIHGANGFMLSDSTHRSSGISSFAATGRLLCSYQTKWISNGNAELLFLPATSLPHFGVGSVTALTLGASSVTFTTTNVLQVQVGDIFFWKMLAQGSSSNQPFVPALKVTGISGNDVTCSMLFDPLQYDTVAHQASATTMSMAVRQWAPTQALTCDMNNSTTITNVTPATIVKNGDWIIGAGIPASTRVVSGAGTATLVLSQATTGGSASSVPMYFGRLYTPTVSAAF